LKPKKILIIRFSSIGDIVLTSPVVRCIKKQLPDAQIYFLTKKQFVPVIEASPFIHRIISFQDNLFETIGELRKIDFDCIIDLHKNLRTFFIKSFFPFTAKYSFDKLNFEKWLLVNFKINRLPDKHIVDRYFDGIKKLGIENDGEGLDFFISKENEFDTKQLPDNFRTGYVVFSIGGNHATKKMPVEKWKVIAKQIKIPAIILAGIEEWERGEQIRSANSGIINFCGKTNIAQSASIIRQSQLIVTHDTGLMHIAAAFQKPVISIWGNTVPEFGMSPYYGSQQIINHKSDLSCQRQEIRNLHCRPCSKIGHEKCPEGHFDCMMKQDENKIAESINKLLQQY
jgi:ADP-heptose:LPS heptosyltransferase